MYLMNDDVDADLVAHHNEQKKPLPQKTKKKKKKKNNLNVKIVDISKRVLHKGLT